MEIERAKKAVEAERARVHKENKKAEKKAAAERKGVERKNKAAKEAERMREEVERTKKAEEATEAERKREEMERTKKAEETERERVEEERKKAEETERERVEEERKKAEEKADKAAVEEQIRIDTLFDTHDEKCGVCLDALSRNAGSVYWCNHCFRAYHHTCTDAAVVLSCMVSCSEISSMDGCTERKVRILADKSEVQVAAKTVAARTGEESDTEAVEVVTPLNDGVTYSPNDRPVVEWCTARRQMLNRLMYARNLPKGQTSVEEGLNNERVEEEKKIRFSLPAGRANRGQKRKDPEA